MFVMIGCPACNKSIARDSTLCPHCGATIADAAPTQRLSHSPFEVTLLQGMTDHQRLLFQQQMAAARKSEGAALALTLLLGSVGAHRFYLGEFGLGVLYLLFCWTFVPLIISVVELFVISKRVGAYNDRQALQIAAQVRALGGPAVAPMPTAP